MSNEVSPKHVLLVHDEEPFLRIMEDELRNGGYQVTAYTDIVQAHTHITQPPSTQPPAYDILVLDIFFGEKPTERKNSFYYIDRWHRQNLYTNTPTIFLSSDPRRQALEKLSQKRGGELLITPLDDINELVERVDKLTENRDIPS